MQIQKSTNEYQCQVKVMQIQKHLHENINKVEPDNFSIPSRVSEWFHCWHRCRKNPATRDTGHTEVE